MRANSPFQPITGMTISIENGEKALPVDGGSYRIVNEGGSSALIGFGLSGLTPDIPVPAGAIEILTVPKNPSQKTVFASVQGGPVRFTPGFGGGGSETLSVSGIPARARVGDYYEFAYNITGGVPPYIVTGTGVLPDGLTNDTNALMISGTPTEVGNFNYTINVKDAEDSTAGRVFNILVEAQLSPPVNVTPPSIAGIFGVGETLTLNFGDFDGAQPIILTSELKSSPDGITNWAVIQSPAQSTYLIEQTDEGNYFRLDVTATNVDGELSVSSAVTGKIQPPIPSGIVFDGIPAFVQSDGDGGWEPADPSTTNENVQIFVPDVSGGVPPYTYEYAIYDSDDDSVIVARDSGKSVETGDLEGKTIYARVWAIDAASNEAHADSLPWGPIEGEPAGVVVAQVSFRGSWLGSGAGNPVKQPAGTWAYIRVDNSAEGDHGDNVQATWDFVSNPPVPGQDSPPAPVPMGSYDVPSYNMPNNAYKSNERGGGTMIDMMQGNIAFTSLSNYFTMKIPAGRYRMQAVFANSSADAGTGLRPYLFDGLPADKSTAPAVLDVSDSQADAPNGSALVTSEEGADGVEIVSFADIAGWDITDPTSGKWITIDCESGYLSMIKNPPTGVFGTSGKGCMQFIRLRRIGDIPGEAE